MGNSALKALLKHENAVVLAALVVLTLLAWLALLAGAGTGMSPAAMSGCWLPMALPAAESWSWTPYYWLIAFVMWAVMMVAMMLPSAAPMVLLYGKVVQHADAKNGTHDGPSSITAFASGYLALWILFSALAVVLQFGLERSGVMTGMMSLRSPALSGALLIAAGLYQLSPLKTACLRHCRGPAAFLTAHWRPGIAGAWRMGIRHGAYCVGCCAVLMLLLFVGGVMNLVWIAGLTLFVAFEKFAPFGEAATKVTAALLVAGGLALFLAWPSA
jgi:predicted metal-binding membrane protein